MNIRNRIQAALQETFTIAGEGFKKEIQEDEFALPKDTFDAGAFGGSPESVQEDVMSLAMHLKEKGFPNSYQIAKEVYSFLGERLYQ